MIQASQIHEESSDLADAAHQRELTMEEIELVSGGARCSGCTFSRTYVFPTPRGDGDCDCAD